MKEIINEHKQCTGCAAQCEELPKNAGYFEDPDGFMSGVWYECVACGSTQFVPEEKILDLPKAKKLRRKAA